MSTRLPKNKAKKEHWVPFSYLKNFAIPGTKNHKEPKAWIFSKDQGDPKPVPVRSFARKKFLYSPRDKHSNRSWETEDKLHNLESLMSRIWPSFDEGLVDFVGNASIKKGLALYMATLFLRHPSNIKLIKSIHSQLTDLYESLTKDERGNPFIGEVIYKGKSIPFDNSGYKEYKSADDNDFQHMFVDFINSEARGCAEILLEKRWSMIFSETPVFITTDNPVVVENLERERFGLSTKGTIITFPISPTRLLVLDDLKNEPNGRYYPLGNHGPGPINLSLWRGSKENMLSHRHTDEVISEMLAWADEYEKENV